MAQHLEALTKKGVYFASDSGMVQVMAGSPERDPTTVFENVWFWFAVRFGLVWFVLLWLLALKWLLLSSQGTTRLVDRSNETDAKAPHPKEYKGRAAQLGSRRAPAEAT